MDLGGTALIIRRLIVPLTVAVMTFHAGQGFAQVPFPAPLPGQQATPSSSGSAFPRVDGSASAGTAPAVNSFPAYGGAPGFQSAPAGPQAEADQCMKAFMPLREDAEKRGKLIKAAGERHAPPQEACELFTSFGEAEIKMIQYVESHATKCWIPQRISDQLKNGHKKTETMQRRVCAVAEQTQKSPAGPTGDFWPAGARDRPNGVGE